MVFISARRSFGSSYWNERYDSERGGTKKLIPGRRWYRWMGRTMIGLRDAELGLFLWDILMTARITLEPNRKKNQSMERKIASTSHHLNIHGEDIIHPFTIAAI